MPVLSFPCTLVSHRDARRIPFRTMWIKGFDLRELALAATALLKGEPTQCGYALYEFHGSPEQNTQQHRRTQQRQGPAEQSRATQAGTSSSAGVYLEVVRPNPHASAIVGPMGGPALPAILSPERCYSLDELLAHAQLGRDAATHGAYVVIVKYAGICPHPVSPPPRGKEESDEDYLSRRTANERARVEHARHEGIHVIRYDVPPETWRAADLDTLMALIYRLLPTNEPRWREVGAVTQETFAGDRAGREPTYQYCLQVARGEYVAHLRLPLFPSSALVDWLRTRRCDISLCHPVVSDEASTRAAAHAARMASGPTPTASPVVYPRMPSA